MQTDAREVVAIECDIEFTQLGFRIEALMNCFGDPVTAGFNADNDWVGIALKKGRQVVGQFFD
jgi:hypothetical protein